MTQDKVQALKYLALSKMQKARFLLAEIYYGDNDFAQKAEFFNEFAPAENKSALFILGYNYLHGKNGFEQNVNKGIQCLTAAARYGDPKAQNSLGWAYYTGEFIPRDMKKAFEWTMTAVKNGNPNGMETLFRMYRDGSGVEQDLNEAIAWLERASDITQEQCAPVAVSELGECYEYGLYGIGKDEEKAFMYYSHPVAQRTCLGKYNLGRCYLRGIGTAQNIPQGLKYLTEAAQKEDTSDHIYQERAMELLAEIYRSGEAGTVDEAKAGEWLQKADQLKAQKR